MFELSEITFFGLSQTDMGDLSAVTAAIGAAETLEPEDVYALVESLGGNGLEHCADSYFEAHRRGDVQGALSAKEEFLRDVAATKGIVWKHSRPKAETKLTLFASAMAMRASADKIFKVQAARRQLLIEGDKDQEKSEKIFQQIALRALEEDELGIEELEAIYQGKSRWALAALTIINQFERFQALLQSKTRLELAQKGLAIVEKEQKRMFDELRIGQLQMGQALGERMVAFAIGPMKLIVAIDTLKTKSILKWKEEGESESSILLHRLGNKIARDVFSGTALIDLARAGRTPRSGRILSIFSRLGGVEGLNAVVHSAVIKNVIAATAKGIQIEMDVPPDLPINEEKQGKLEEVLNELVCNAVKYADPAKSEKWIRIGWNAERQVLTIADNGIGIQNTEKIWEDGPDSRQAPDYAEGSGQGLAIVKRLLAEIGWMVEVESTLGVGSTFKLCPLGSEKIV